MRRRIMAPKGETTRPTTDFLRETLFNLLESRASLERVLDLFAGSGAVGLEAWSRGSLHVSFVERDRAALEALRANIQHLAADDAVQVLPMTVERALKRLAKDGVHFTLVFLDPPYGDDSASRALESLSEQRLDAPDGLVVVQHATRDELAVEVAAFRRVEERRYGNSSFTFYRREVTP